MPNSAIQRRQAAERARIETFESSLRRVSQRARPAPDFIRAIEEAQRGFETEVVREPSSWRPHMKTRDIARLRLAAARHLFARYPVADHLEQVWIDSTGLDRDEILLRKRWYVVAAGGGSLYRAGAGAWLSRKEVHAFLNPPGRLGFEEAFWQAISRSFTDDVGIAMRIACTRIARTQRADIAFWREAARFFCVNPTTSEEINDACDFLADSLHCNRAYAMKGRTLGSLRRHMREWHRDLAAIARIDAARRRAEAARAGARGLPATESAGGRWPGAKIADWSWSPKAGVRGQREEYVIKQLTTAADLVTETRAMHHCVASYATKCIAGQASIWSLRRKMGGESQRLLTIELDVRHRAVQVRGFANRLALADERKILERWSKARGVELLL